MIQFLTGFLFRTTLFTGLEIDLDVLIEFGKVCAVEALEAGWYSLHDNLWMGGQID